MYVQAWLRTGAPPAQPAGEEDVTALVCVPFGWHAPYAEYVKDVQVAGGGGVYVQVWLKTGAPPVQPAGDEVSTVLVCVPSGWHGA